MSDRERSFNELVAESQLRLHLKEPDYTQPLLKLTSKQAAGILEKLMALYGKEDAESCFAELERILQVYYAHKTPEMLKDDVGFDAAQRFTEKDVILITYGDLLQEGDKKPLRALVDALEANTDFSVSTIHLLPFYPYSSDRGFSVIDYEEVDPHLGTWEEIEELSLRYRLMFDGVFNHVSSKSRWFQEFLNGNPIYRDYFIRFSTKQAIPEDYRKMILRPRTTDLLTGFDTIGGRQYVWTTFSPDQIDLNYRNPEVLLRIIEVILYYVRRGADILRLDAVTYMWYELGTDCALLEESHVLVQLLRTVLDIVAPQVALITETNVPHEDNIQYFGDGTNQAQMVYNFALPPLALYSFWTGDCRKLAQWASTLEHISDTGTYFNFLDSHDGIGLLPVRGILEESETEFLIDRARQQGSLISYRSDQDGRTCPYEINATWFSALNGSGSEEPLATKVDRFIASRAIALALKGVPGIYLPSLVGSQNDVTSVMMGGDARNINRGTLDVPLLKEKINESGSLTERIFCRFGELVRLRTRIKAFHPNSMQEVLEGDSSVLSIVRRTRGGTETVLALTNVSNQPQEVHIPLSRLGSPADSWHDLLTGAVCAAATDHLTVSLKPYQVSWLTPIDSILAKPLTSDRSQQVLSPDCTDNS